MKDKISAGIARIAVLALIALVGVAFWGLVTLMPSRAERDRRTAETVCVAGHGTEDPACAEAVAASGRAKDGDFMTEVVFTSIL